MRVKIAVLLLAVTLISGCPRGDEVTKGSNESLGPHIWSVDKLRIGDDFQKVTELLGPGDVQRSDATQPYRIYRFKGRLIGAKRNRYTVAFDTNQKVAAIRGTDLQRDGQTVLSNLSSEDGLVSTLGIGYVKKTFKVKHGFLGIGSIPHTATYFYKDAQDNQLIVHIHYNYNTIHDTTRPSSSIVLRKMPTNPKEQYAYGFQFWH